MMRRIAPLLCAIALLSGCGGPPPPEGFAIAIRFVSIDVSILDQVRLSFRPSVGQAFAAQPEMTFEDGLVTTRVESDGALIMEIDGDHVRANATRPDGSQWVYELEIWSDDPTMNEEPLVLASATRSGMFIGQGMIYLPTWPPPEGGSVQLAIECSGEAAAAGLCAP